MIPSTAVDGIADEQYPLSAADLLERYGDVELDVPEGSESIGDAVDRLEETEYPTPESVHSAVYAGVGAEAIGRRHYSDRDPTPVGSAQGHDQLSF